jgi:hypothetical protein
MSYQPNPVDTSHIDLGQLGGLTEFLAEQGHEVWAQKRMAEGWTYGPARDDKLKQTPDMMAYEKLSDSERDYDRKMSAHTLKLILDQGYQLSPPDKRVPVVVGEGPPSPDTSDMTDEQEIAWLKSRQPKEPFLGPFVEHLEWLGRELTPSFQGADKSASRNQKLYLHASLWCLICAGLAVLLAIYQLADFTTFGAPPLALPITELVLVVIAVSLVLLDFQKQWRDTWLADRSRAERLRVLKFRSLLNPGFWSGVTRPQVEAAVRGSVRHIDSIGPEHLERHLVDADLDPAAPGLLTGNQELDRAIGNYYLRRRLIAQSDYFASKEREYRHADQRTKLLGTALFFGVLLFVFAHDVVDVVKQMSNRESANHSAAGKPEGTQQPARQPDVPNPEDWPGKAGRLLIACAAILPAASATLHVYRSGREAGRNHLRSLATYTRLSNLRTHLEGSENRKEQIRLMIQGEATLATEHQQWLQLMKECEWFG